MSNTLKSFQAVFAIFWFHAVVNGGTIKQDVNLISKNLGHYDNYEGNFDYTIENFLLLPYHPVQKSFTSSVFPKSNASNGVSWEFEIYPQQFLKTGEKVVGIQLMLKTLPSNASSIQLSLKCGIVDYWGDEQYVKLTPEMALRISYSNAVYMWIIERDVLLTKAKELVPNGKFHLKCTAKGFLTYENVPHEKIMYTEEMIPRNASDCGKELASDTVMQLSEGDFNLQPDIVLESSGKQFKRHKSILSARSPVFAEIFNKTNNYLDVVTVFNFTDEMNAVELEDMLSFLYQGTALHLDQSCRTLYVVARKYQLDCLKVTCEEVLMKAVNSVTALDLQSFAVKYDAIRLMKWAAACVSKYPDDCTF